MLLDLAEVASVRSLWPAARPSAGGLAGVSMQRPCREPRRGGVGREDGELGGLGCGCLEGDAQAVAADGDVGARHLGMPAGAVPQNDYDRGGRRGLRQLFRE